MFDFSGFDNQTAPTCAYCDERVRVLSSGIESIEDIYRRACRHTIDCYYSPDEKHHTERTN